MENICINIEADELGVPNYEKTVLGAKTIQSIAKETDGGLGNFNFTINYNCPSYIPYFPACFHTGEQEKCFVLGFESPDLLLAAIQNISSTLSHNEFLNQAYSAMQKALQYHIDQIIPTIKNSHLNMIFHLLA